MNSFDQTYDLIVVGGGPAGTKAAVEAASAGKSVLLIEKDLLGGTCLNRGCIPTKALLRSSGLFRELADNGAALGVPAEAKLDLAAMYTHVAETILSLRTGLEDRMKRLKVQVVRGTAKVLDAHTVCVEQTVGSVPDAEAAGNDLDNVAAGKAEPIAYTGSHLLICTGSRPATPPIPGSDLPGVCNSDVLLAGLEALPERVVIIGGGVIGAEFSEFFTNLGSKVTVLEALPRLLANMDKDFGQSLATSLKKAGADVQVNARVSEIRKAEPLEVVFTDKKGNPGQVPADLVLICTGRRPVTEGLFPADMETALGMVRGFVPVDMTSYETAVPGVYAVGDIVAGGLQLAHAAEAEAVRAVRHMFGLGEGKDLSLVPSCVFTQPEIASVGLTAEQAKEAGYAVKTRKQLTSANAKAVVEGAGRGYSQLVYEEGTGRLLGAHLLCPHASEMIGPLGVLIGAHGTIEDLDRTVFPHPTVSEILPL